jgi:hypothetical protein
MNATQPMAQRRDENRRCARAGPVVGAAVLVAVAIVSWAKSSLADEGGVSFWLTGQFGSLAAVPQQPGLSIASVFYRTSLNGEGGVAAAREITIDKFTGTVNINLNLNLKARADLVFLSPSYVFASPVLGGQLAVGMAGTFGRNSTSLNGTLTASVDSLTATQPGSISDSRDGVGDLYPQASLRWNNGVNNFMTYMMGDIPVGAYDSSRLSNFGIGHGAIDGGAGYTYFSSHTGHEFSAVTGLTGNLPNTATDYQNGIDWHMDWGASQFLSQQLYVGVVGYLYKQLSADSGAAAILGDNKSQVAGIGPQIGYLFPVRKLQGFLGVKAYGEFAADRRAHGWNAWLTFAISPAAPTPTAATPPLYRN